MPSRVVQFVKRAFGVIDVSNVPTPPPYNKNVPGAYALFMDEDEREILYAKPWPYIGCPTDDRTGSTHWLIEGQRFGPARQDLQGNWIFRRMVK